MITTSLLSTCLTTTLLLITHTPDVCFGEAAAAAAAAQAATAALPAAYKPHIDNKQLNSAETTTSLLPLQPPFNVTSTTTSIFQQRQQQHQPEHSIGDNAAVNLDDSWLSNSTKKSNGRKYHVLGPRAPANYQNHLTDLSEQHKQQDQQQSNGDALQYVHGFITTTVLSNETTAVPTNSHGYIQFEVNSPKSSNKNNIRNNNNKISNKKQETVNQVLSSLFPNGFSDIFRFSYAAESTTTQQTPHTHSSRMATPTPTTTTTTTAPPTLTPPPTVNRTHYSFATSVTREYRRELSPGHTEIVVEKIENPHPISAGDEFKDGNNQLTKDDLMRINRAAVDASVLPSLLLNPTQESDKANNSSVTDYALKPAPIIILNESAPDSDENDEADNQIAESQNIGQQLYQAVAFNPSKHPLSDINVHIVHDDTLANAQSESFQSRQQKHTPLAHEDAENQISQQKYVQEAPSRKFLKTFNPKLSESANRPIPKGNFHYEVAQGQHPGNYGTYYIRPAAQLEYQQQQPAAGAQLSSKSVATDDHYQGYASNEQATELPQSVVFVTLSTPTHAARNDKKIETRAVSTSANAATPHEYVSEAAKDTPQPQNLQKSASRPAYTYVEVQKSVNIHNKLITEKDGQLVEQHETIYPQQQNQQQQQQEQQQQQQQQQQRQQYESLTANPIHVQHIDSDTEEYAEAASQSVQQQVPAADSYVQNAVEPAAEPAVAVNYANAYIHADSTQPQYLHDNVAVSHYTNAEQETVQAPAQHYYDQQIAAEPLAFDAYHAQQDNNQVQIEEQHMAEHHPPPVEHTAPQQHFHVQEVIEHHIPVPYAVPEPVPVPVHVQHFIDRPYPVETIVEKRVPYPVETVVEKIVEKQVPVEVERIVEKPVEKIVEKYVDRPVAVPIHVPVGIHIPIHSAHGDYGHTGYGHTSYGPSAHGQHDFLPWAQQQLPQQQPHSVSVIPHKVLRNYYTRMLKKLMPQMAVLKLTPTTAPQTATKSHSKKSNKPTSNTKQSQKTSFKVSDGGHFDLNPPPPPASSSWSQGARYIYNTLPRDLTAAGASAYNSVSERYKGLLTQATALAAAASAPATAAAEPYDEFQRWRNGHTLKRSPDFGRNLHMEYGFKPPLVPSLEIDDHGMPLKASNAKSDE